MVVGCGLSIVPLDGADASCGVEVGFIALPSTGANVGATERVRMEPGVDAGFGMGVKVGTGVPSSSPGAVPSQPLADLLTCGAQDLGAGEVDISGDGKEAGAADDDDDKYEKEATAAEIASAPLCRLVGCPRSACSGCGPSTPDQQ